MVKINRPTMVKVTDFSTKLPKNLIRKISDLLQKNISVVKILAQVRDFIPDNIPESVLEDYISQMMKRS